MCSAKHLRARTFHGYNFRGINTLPELRMQRIVRVLLVLDPQSVVCQCLRSVKKKLSRHAHACERQHMQHVRIIMPVSFSRVLQSLSRYQFELQHWRLFSFSNCCCCAAADCIFAAYCCSRCELLGRMNKVLAGRQYDRRSCTPCRIGELRIRPLHSSTLTRQANPRRQQTVDLPSGSSFALVLQDCPMGPVVLINQHLLQRKSTYKYSSHIASHLH